MPEVADSQVIRDLKLEYIKTKQECSDLIGRFGPNHPEVVTVRARLEAVAEKMQQEMVSILAVTKVQLGRTEKQEEDLKRELEEQEARVREFSRLAVQYSVLNNSYETLNKTYDAIVKRVEEIEIQMAAGSKDDNIFIITRPSVPVKPARPRKALSLVIAAFLGLVGGVGLCFFIDYLDTTIKTKADAESILRLPVIGYVPAIREGDVAKSAKGAHRSVELLALDKPRSAVAEAFRSVRTALAFSGTDGSLKHFLVTSSSPKEGKTLVSVNLAVTMAQSGKKVLLVDADMRKPRVHKVFRLPAAPGLSNLLVREGVSSTEEAIQSIKDVENLSFLPCGPIPPNPAELLSSVRMRELLKEFDALFDVVIFDTPPVINVTDSVILSQYVHGAIMVVRSFSTQREFARRAKELLTQSQGKVLGVVLNNVDIPRGGYYSYDSYYYYQQYYYYYSDDNKKKVRKRRRRRSHDRTAG